MEDLQRILNRCKSFGTKAIPLYSIEGSCDCDATCNFEVENLREVEETVYVDVECDEGICVWGFASIDVLASVMMDTEQTKGATLGATCSGEVFKVYSELIQDEASDFNLNYLNNVEVFGSGVAAVIQMKTIEGLQALNGSFLTPSVSINPLASDWDQIRTVHTQTGDEEILMDVFREETDESQENYETEMALGTPEYRKISQTLNPRKGEITGITLKAGTIVGTPTDSVKVSLYYANSEGEPYGLPLVSNEIPAASFSGNLKFLVDYEYDLTRTYIFVVERTGDISSDNYYNVACANSPYPRGTKVFNGNYWFTMSYELYYKTLHPIYYAEDAKPPLKLNNFESDNVKVRFKMMKSEVGASPTIQEIYVESIGDMP